MSLFCVWESLGRVWGSEFVLCVGELGLLWGSEFLLFVRQFVVGFR